MALDEAPDRLVDLVGGHPRPDHGAGQRAGLGGEPPGPAHCLDLSGGLNGNHFNALQAPSASMMTWLVASMVAWLATGLRMPFAS